MTTQELVARFDGTRKVPGGWSVRCPAHDDKTASLSIKRQGRVFPIIDAKTGGSMKARSIGVVISTIGKRAGVVVGTTEKVTWEKGLLVRTPSKAFAGAHDLRRAFCSRWAMKVKTPVLQRLARHAHISTTMSYYVSLNADEIGADLWANHGATVGNTCGNTRPETVENAKG